MQKKQAPKLASQNGFLAWVMIFIAIVLSGCINMDWGNHFVLDCSFESQVDSVRMTICLEETMFKYPFKDSINQKITSFEGNVATPESGYPCKVKFLVFLKGDEISLIGEDFNCNHCDIGHSYFLSKDSVRYGFYP